MKRQSTESRKDFLKRILEDYILPFLIILSSLALTYFIANKYL